MSTITQTQTTQEVAIAKPEVKPQAKPSEPFVDEFTALVQEMFTIASEIGLELASSDCPNISNCDICKKAKELVKRVKKLIELSRRSAVVARQQAQATASTLPQTV